MIHDVQGREVSESLKRAKLETPLAIRYKQNCSASWVPVQALVFRLSFARDSFFSENGNL